MLKVKAGYKTVKVFYEVAEDGNFGFFLNESNSLFNQSFF